MLAEYCQKMLLITFRSATMEGLIQANKPNAAVAFAPKAVCYFSS